ncbi:MAG: hypothetical protein M0P12_03175 [Paludibacteraceae bacterium]|jgi:(p)ppGpp synthase/HD superfamily hydrolase|nr:hypothetical protein [Paludibacteraceae bacterium]MCK9616121.1 hypothetical protein [Candidatus Omnitrophota bacterium]
MNDNYDSDMEDGYNEVLDKALAFAKLAHAGQTKKMGEDKGKPYMIHPFRVFQRILAEGMSICIYNYNVIGPASLLHDSIEDGYINGVKVTAQTLLDAGFSQDVVDVVSTLSRDKDKETYFDFIMRVKKNPYAVVIKIADIEDDMIDLEEGSLKDNYRLAHYILSKRI